MKALLRSTGQTVAGAMGEVFPQACEAETKAAALAGWSLDDPAAWCHRCGGSAGPGEATPQGCSACVGKPIAWDRIERLGAYKAPLDTWILSMKFGRQWAWCSWFGGQLARTIGQTDSNRKMVVCPVPMHWMRRCHRGFNQAQLIGESLARERRWPVMSLLGRTQYVVPQTSIPHSQRPANVRSSFGSRPIDLTGWEVWLVDDVKTTGSTLKACTSLLRRAGAVRVNVAVVAVADPHDTDFTQA